MKIFITGGTGFLGRLIITELLKKNHEITTFTMDVNVDMPKTVKVIKGDILDKTSLLKAMKGHDAVYHLAAILDESVAYDKMHKVNVDGTQNVLEACKLSNVKKFIFASSVGVMGDIRDSPADESYPYNPITNYEKTKADAEKLVLKYSLKNDFQVTILRPSIVVGPNDNWRQIIKAVKKGYPYLGLGNNHWHLVDITDTVYAFVLALNDKGKNEVYIIASEDAPTYKEIYETLSRILNVEPPKYSVPVFVAKTIFYIYGRICKLLSKTPSLTYRVSSVERLVRERYFDISKAKKQLGYKPKYDTEKSLKKLVGELEKIKS
ncbi:MAG: NAD-dependent epimerase/dehydratase family protein [DPANN group archaeon]|nr:NAD-dependent epimerase/dehydratase family protein [DPANN group archaeon]